MTVTFEGTTNSIRDIVGSNAIRIVFAAFAGSLFLAILAQITVPFFPVPMTLQSLGVMLVGLTFGFRLATMTVGLYLIEGALGWPVFAGFTGGPAVFISGTGGYLFGFFAASGVMGLLIDRGAGKSLLGRLLVAYLGNIIIFAFGVAYLSSLYGLSKALSYGLYPFMMADLLKVLLACLTAKVVLTIFARFREK